MNLKALIEKRNELLAKLDEFADTIAKEVRGFTEEEQSQITELQAEIESLDKAIKFAESRSKDVVDVIEVTEKEERTADIEFEKRAVDQFIRGEKGEELRSIVTNADPGKMIMPKNFSDFIVEKLFEVAPIFARTRNFTPVNGTLEILREQTIGTAGFVGEMQDVSSNDFTMNKVTLTQKRAGTAIELSQHIVNDSGIDIVSYSINLLTRRLGITLDRNVINGTGDSNNQFEGILTNTNIEAIETSAAGVIGVDDLLDLYNALHPDYQTNGVFVMNRKTFNTLVKLKDGMNQYYLVRDVSNAGAGYRLFGMPVLITDAMPDIEENETPVLFTSFYDSYATMTKKGLSLQHIYGDTTQALRGSHLLVLDGYFDGKVINPDAAKLIKVKATV